MSGLRRVGGRLHFLQPLGLRDFALLWSAAIVSLTGDGIYLVAIAWQTYEISNLPTALSLVGLATAAPEILFLLVGGALSDRLDRRRLMILADLLRAVAIGAIGFMAVAGTLELWHMFVLVAFYATGTALFRPAAAALVPEVVPTEMRPRANALLKTGGTLSVRIAGPALGGVIIAAFGAGTAFLIDAGTFLVAMLAISFITRRPTPVQLGKPNLLGEVREGLGFVRGQAWLGASLGASAVGLLCYMGPVTVLVPYQVKNSLGGDASDLSFVFAAGGAGALCASVAIGQWGLPRLRLTTLYTFWGTVAGSVLLYGLATELWQMMLAGFLGIGAMVGGEIIWATLLQERVPGRLLGRVASLDWLVSVSLVPLSMVLTGPIAEAFGARATLIGAGIVGTTAIALFFFSVPALRGFDRAGLVDDGVADDGLDLRGQRVLDGLVHGEVAVEAGHLERPARLEAGSGEQERTPVGKLGASLD
jgi:DHA3 family tetracycline resistance protein-like MFS transporter